MKKMFTTMVVLFMVFSMTACGNAETSKDQPMTQSSTPESFSPEENTSTKELNGLELSDRVVRITSEELTATFQLYDTTAATEFYDQLPLNLELSNFRDAQWMFYPPEKLNVTDEEVYHDGKKGELSYYEPWGDVFMLYEDFYAGDNMHRLGIGLTGIDDIEAMSGNVVIENQEASQNPVSEEETAMQVQVEANGNITVFALNDSQAARELYEQLPLTIEVENYSTNEKIFYPPKELDVSDASLANGIVGTLAYYAPWGDVVMFYGDFGSASSLYELGYAVSGGEFIKTMSGTIEIIASVSSSGLEE